MRLLGVGFQFGETPKQTDIPFLSAEGQPSPQQQTARANRMILRQVQDDTSCWGPRKAQREPRLRATGKFPLCRCCRLSICRLNHFVSKLPEGAFAFPTQIADYCAQHSVCHRLLQLKQLRGQVCGQSCRGECIFQSVGRDLHVAYWFADGLADSSCDLIEADVLRPEDVYCVVSAWPAQ